MHLERMRLACRRAGPGAALLGESRDVRL